MVDVNRIRERAADWLGDMGDAALARLNEAVRAVRGRELHEVFERGDDSDDELRARIKAELGRSAPAAPSYACGDAGCRMVGQEQNRAGACPACWRELDALPDEDAATDPSVEPASVGAWPWRGLEYDACLSPAQPDTWLVEALDAPDERGYLARFYGLHAEERAREYAALMSAPLPCTPVLLVAQERAADNGLWCDRHGGRFADDALLTSSEIQEQRISHGGCTRLPRAMLDALGVKDGDLVWFVRSAPGGRWEAWRSDEIEREFGLPGDGPVKPSAVAMGQRWSCVVVESELEVCELRPALSGFSAEVGLRHLGSAGPATMRARETDMLGLKEWRFLG